MKKTFIVSLLLTAVFLFSCTKALEKGLVKTGEEIKEIEQESQRIRAEMDAAVLADCCDACSYNYGKEPLPENTPCAAAINQNRDSIYNVRSEEMLNDCITLFEKTPRTIAACR